MNGGQEEQGENRDENGTEDRCIKAGKQEWKEKEVELKE